MAEPQLKIYKVEAPDGSILKLEGPVNASPEDIIRNAEILFNQRQAQKPQYNMGAESLRSLAQGATFGFADELEAAARAGGKQLSREMQQGGLASQILPEQQQPMSLSQQMMGGLAGTPQTTSTTATPSEYKQIRDEIRGRQALFQKENPVLSTGLEIAGGLAVPIAGAAGAAGKGATVAGNIARGAGYGALYGAGQAKEMSDIPFEAATGAGTAGLFTGTFGILGRGIAPKITEAAKKLKQQGINLTPGQAFGGKIGAAEEAMSDVVSSIGNRRIENLKKWNETVINRALKPLGQKVKIEGDDIQGAVDAATQKISNSYERIVPKLKLNPTENFRQKAATILNSEEFVTADATVKQKFRNFINDEMTSLQGGKFGDALKNKQTALGNRITDLTRAGGDDATLGRMIGEYKNVFEKQILAQNPQYGAELGKINTAFKDMARVTDASAKIKAAGEAFTPDQLLSSAKRMDLSSFKRKTAAGTAPMVRTAREGASLGSTLPNSGTTARALYNVGVPLMSTIAATGGAGGVGLLPLIPFAGAYGLYSKGGQNLFNRLIQEPSATRAAIGQGLTQYSPAAASLLNLKDNQ